MNNATEKRFYTLVTEECSDFVMTCSAGRYPFKRSVYNEDAALRILKEASEWKVLLNYSYSNECLITGNENQDSGSIEIPRDALSICLCDGRFIGFIFDPNPDQKGSYSPSRQPVFLTLESGFVSDDPSVKDYVCFSNSGGTDSTDYSYYFAYRLVKHGEGFMGRDLTFDDVLPIVFSKDAEQNEMLQLYEWMEIQQYRQSDDGRKRVLVPYVLYRSGKHSEVETAALAETLCWYSAFHPDRERLCEVHLYLDKITRFDSEYCEKIITRLKSEQDYKSSFFLFFIYFCGIGGKHSPKESELYFQAAVENLKNSKLHDAQSREWFIEKICEAKAFTAELFAK